jgi:hypothetical protein
VAALPAAPEDAKTVAIFQDGDLSAETVATLAASFRLLAIPHAPNARGLAALDVECATWDEILGHTGGVVYVGVDPNRAVDISEWGPAVKRAAWAVAIDALPTALHASVDLVIPAAWGGEQEGTLVNLEGRLQRMTVGADTPGEVVPQLRWIAGLGRRLGAKVPGHAAGAFRQLANGAAGRLPVTTHGAIPPSGILGVQGGPTPAHAPEQGVAPGSGELALYVAPFLYDAVEVEHAEAMDFLRDEARLHVNRADARAAGLSRGERATLELDGRSVDVTVVPSRRVAPGHARVHAGTPGFAPGRTGWHVARLHAVTALVTAAAASAMGGED